MKTHTDRYVFCFVSEYRPLQDKEQSTTVMYTACSINVATRIVSLGHHSLQHEIQPHDGLHFFTVA